MYRKNQEDRQGGPVKTGWIQSLAYGVIRVVGVGIFLYLTYYCLRYSQYLFPQTREFPIEIQDVPIYNILAMLILCAAVFALQWMEMKLTERNKLWIERVFLALSLLWIACCCFWWISALDRQPVADQAYIYGGASYFMEGQYSFLGEGGYCASHPYQLGLIALVELLFLALGPYNYFAYQIMCAVMAVGIAFLGYCLLKELAVSFGARMIYCLLIMGCVPLVCYTSWVYGEIPSLFFAMLTACFVVRWENCGKKRYLACIVITCAIAVLARKASVILLIALCLLTVVCMIRCRNWQIGAAVLLAVLCSYFAYQGIYKMYEIRSGYEHSDGIPVNAWIAMGMMEQEGRCGWYNNMELSVYYSFEYDREATKEAMNGYIEERLDTFRANHAYARWFFERKVLSQWNDPLYQSVYFSAQDLERHPTEPGSFLEGLYSVPEVHDKAFHFADVMQFLVYFGMLLYYLFAIRKDAKPLEYLLAVTIIGGFFFSIIWEAKARYIFPYYVMMYPLTVMGYFEAARRGVEFICRSAIGKKKWKQRE